MPYPLLKRAPADSLLRRDAGPDQRFQLMRGGRPAAVMTRTELLQTWRELEDERFSWISHWRELNNLFLPRSARFCYEDKNKGHKRHNNIYNATATLALRTTSAAMMASASSPARPWFKCRTSDPALNKFHTAKRWLDEVTEALREQFLAGNTYRTLHGIYDQLIVFGTGCSVMLPDFESVFWHYPSPIGEFAIAQDYRGRVCVLYRKFTLTVRQLQQQFGLENCSRAVQDLARLKRWNTPIVVINAIEPREEHDPAYEDALNMPWRSCWFELGSAAEKGDQLLRESGFPRFPALVPRWWVDGGDVYGGSLAMDALGGTKGLQLREISLARAIEYGVQPPLQLPTAMKDRDVDLMPGGKTFADSLTSGGGIRPMWQVGMNIEHLRIEQRELEARLHKHFFSDMWVSLTMANDSTQRTAAEIAMRNEEKMFILGPVVARLEDELFTPLIRNAFEEMMARGALPPPPPELRGENITIEYVSVLANAQKTLGLNNVDRFLGTLATVSTIGNGMLIDVVDKFNADEWVDSNAGVLIDAAMVRSNDEVTKLRQARAAATAARQQMEAVQQTATAAKDLAAAPTGTDQKTALSDAMSLFTGYGEGTP